MPTSIETRGLGKAYRRYASPGGRLLELASLGAAHRHRLHWALRGVELELQRGAMLGVVGANGSGKSTLLKLLAGATRPTEGAYRVHGRVASLLELGAGFHPELSGRENLSLASRLAGLDRRAAQRIEGPALEFARVEHVADEPVRTYSTGMAMRLGFAAATAWAPEVLLLDEVLAVGDLAFQERCVERVLDFKRRNVTIVFASHSLYDVRQLCDRALWLEGGAPAGLGGPELVTNAYAARERALAAGADRTSGEAPRPDLPHLTAVEVVPAGGACEGPVSTGDDLEVRVDWRAPGGRRVQVGVAITRADRTIVAAAATHHDGVAPAGEAGRAVLELPALPLLSGSFRVVAYLFDADGVQRWDERAAPGRLEVLAGTREVGEWRLRHAWRLEREADARGAAA